jgi:hypothetical protein
MRYYFKVISTNTRDLKTGLLFFIDESSYLFNCPDGFQRVASIGQTNVFDKGMQKSIFVSTLKPEHFGGFPGYFMTSRL